MQVYICEFEASVVDMVSSGPARSTQQEPVSKIFYPYFFWIILTVPYDSVKSIDTYNFSFFSFYLERAFRYTFL